MAHFTQTLGFIHIEPTPKNMEAVLWESGRVDNLDKEFVTMLATIMVVRKSYTIMDNGSAKIVERDLDETFDWIDSNVSRYTL